MTQPADRPGNPALSDTINQPRVIQYYRKAKRGISNTGSSILSYAPLERLGQNYVWKWTSWLITAPFKRAAVMIWGAPKAMDPDTIFVKIKQYSYWSGYYYDDMPLNKALAKGLVTPELASKHQEAIHSLGYQTVKFDYKWDKKDRKYTLVGSEKDVSKSTFDGLLKVALKKGYISIDQAIARNFITEEQAIAGRWKESVTLSR